MILKRLFVISLRNLFTNLNGFQICRGIFLFIVIAYKKKTDEEISLLSQGILKYTFEMFTLLLKK